MELGNTQKLAIYNFFKALTIQPDQNFPHSGGVKNAVAMLYIYIYIPPACEIEKNVSTCP
jgi:hypothetical protein